MKFQLISISILFFSLCSINVSSAPSGGASDCEFYSHQTVVAVVAVVNAGENELYSYLPGCGIARSNTQVFRWTAQWAGPIALVAGTITWAATTFSGCTIGAITVNQATLASVSGSTAYADITMTSNECHGSIQFRAILAAATVYDWRVDIPINIRVEQPNYSFLCAAPQKTANAYTPATDTCIDPQINNYNFLCAATSAVPSAFNEAATTCNPPILTTNGVNVNANLDFLCNYTGTTLNSFNPATTVCNVPVMGNYLCGGVPGTACQTPQMQLSGSLAAGVTGTINVVNSGGQNIAITSWPQLQMIMCGATTSPNTGLCTTPTINIQNSAGQTFAISGTLTNHLDGTVNVANSGGQAITISSWPTLNAVLSGTVTIPQTCTSSSHCFIDVSNTGVLTVHQDDDCLTTNTCNFDVHQDEACGAVVHCKVDMTCLAGTCQSMVSNSTVNVNQTSSNNLILGVLPYNLLLVAIAFFAIAGESKSDVLYWVMCLILSIILIVVRPADSIIPYPFFVGWIFVVLYQTIALLSNNKATNLGGNE